MGAGLDVRRRGIKGLPGGDHRLTRISLERRIGGRRRRDLGAVRLVGGNEQTERAIRWLEVGARDALNVLRRHLLHLVPVIEEEPPVSERHPIAEREPEGARVGRRELEHLQHRCLCALHFVGRRRLSGGDGLGGGENGRLRAVERLILPHERGEEDSRGIVLLKVLGLNAGGLLRLNERLEQPAGSRIAHHPRQDVDRRKVGMSAARHVIVCHHDLCVTGAPHGRDTLAILRRLDGVRLLEDARRPRDRSELLLHECERSVFVEVASNHYDRIVGLVMLSIESLEPVDRCIFDIALRTDGQMPVGVEQVRAPEHALERDLERIVLADLELVPHDRELLFQIRARHDDVRHAVGFEVERPREIGVGRSEVLIEVRAVERGRRRRRRAMRGDLFGRLGMLRRPLEEHVLEQVRHPCLPVALVPRADEIRDVHRRLRLRLVREEKNAKPVRKPVLSDSFDARATNDGGRGRRSWSLRGSGARHHDADGGDGEWAKHVRERHTTSGRGYTAPVDRTRAATIRHEREHSPDDGGGLIASAVLERRISVVSACPSPLSFPSSPRLTRLRQDALGLRRTQLRRIHARQRPRRIHRADSGISWPRHRVDSRLKLRLVLVAAATRASRRRQHNREAPLHQLRIHSDLLPASPSPPHTSLTRGPTRIAPRQQTRHQKN